MKIGTGMVMKKLSDRVLLNKYLLFSTVMFIFAVMPGYPVFAEKTVINCTYRIEVDESGGYRINSAWLGQGIHYGVPDPIMHTFRVWAEFDINNLRGKTVTGIGFRVYNREPVGNKITGLHYTSLQPGNSLIEGISALWAQHNRTDYIYQGFEWTINTGGAWTPSENGFTYFNWDQYRREPGSRSLTDDLQKRIDNKTSWFAVEFACEQCIIDGPKLSFSEPDESFSYSVVMEVETADIIIFIDEKNFGQCESCDTCPSGGNPINFATGNKYETENDLTLPGPGLPMHFVRYYNSRNSNDRNLGYGWTGSFSEYITSGTGKLILHEASTREVHFIYDGIGGYVSEADTVRKIGIISGGYLLTEPDGKKLTFGSDGKLTQIADRNGNTQTVGYVGGKPGSVRDNFGRQIGFLYDSNGRLGTLTTPVGNFTYTYDAVGNLTQVTKPDATARQYKYKDPDNPHNLTGIINENNVLYAIFAYDAQGRAVSSEYIGGQNKVQIAYNDDMTCQITDARGNITSFTLQAQNGIGRVRSSSGSGCSVCPAASGKTFALNSRLQPDGVTDAGGNVTAYTYDNRGNILTVKEAVGTAQERVIGYTWDTTSYPNYVLSSVREKSAANPAGEKVTSFTYDSSGNLRQMIESGFSGTTPISRTTAFTYNSFGQITGIDGPLTDVSDTVTIEYYPNEASQGQKRGMLKKITDPVGNETVFSQYNAFGKPGQITDAKGVLTTVGYDTMGRMTSVSKAGYTTNFYYDNTGKLKTVILPGNRNIGYTYTDSGLLKQITDNAGNYIAYSYDPGGNKTGEEVHDSGGALNKYVNFQYDDYNRLSKLLYPGEVYEQCGYDGNSNLTQHTDARFKSTGYGYDALKRLISTTQPGNIVTGFGYDSQDNLTGVTDARNNATAYVYDDFGRAASVTSPDSGLTNYADDAAGNMISRTDCNGITVNYQYDAANRLTAIVYPDSSLNVSFGYDGGTYGKGHLTSVSDVSGQTAYTYNPAGQITSETRIMNGHNYVTHYGYDPVSGDLSSMTYPGGTVLTYQRDNNGQISGILADGQPVVSSVSYMPFGPAKDKTFGSGFITVSKTYDNRYRLSRIQAGRAADYQYGYDAAGNITSFTGFQIPDYEVGNTQYAYIANRLVSTAGRSYVYDSDGNILSDGIRNFTYNQDNRLIRVSLKDVVIGEYFYDAFGRRVKKTALGKTTLFVYDLAGNLIAETDENGNPQRDYIYLNGEPVALKLYGDKAGMYYFINDHLGTPQKIVSSSGQVVWAAAYLPFGKARIKPETITNNLRFPGQYFDAESGLHYNWNRYYDPERGRYITPDPIGLAGGVNLYAYVNGNPINFKDVFGLDWFDVQMIINDIGQRYNMTIPDSVKYTNEVNPQKSDAKADRWNNSILLHPSEFDRVLDKASFDELYRTIYHEMKHLNGPEVSESIDTWYKIFTGKITQYHKDIYKEEKLIPIPKGLYESRKDRCSR